MTMLINIISNLNWNEGTWQSLHGQHYHWFVFVFFNFFSMSVMLLCVCDKVTRLLKLKWTLFHVSWWWNVDKIFASKSHTQVSIFISWNKSCNIYAHILETITYLLTYFTYLLVLSFRHVLCCDEKSRVSDINDCLWSKYIVMSWQARHGRRWDGRKTAVRCSTEVLWTCISR